MRSASIAELLLREQATWMTVPPRKALWMYTTTGWTWLEVACDGVNVL